MPVTRLSQAPDDNTNDAFGLVEGSICALSDSLVVVGSLSSLTQVVHLWAIDISGSVPNVGPDTRWYSYGNDWTTPPTADDPVATDNDTINDLSYVIAMGPTTFAMVGASNDLMVDGRYHVASFFEVNATTLDITRTGVCGITDAESFTWFPDEVTAARWGDRLVVINDESENAYLVCSPDGSVEIRPLPEQLAFNAASAVAVTGDLAIIATFVPGAFGAEHADDMQWWAVDLNTNAIVGDGIMTDLGSDNWSLQSTTMPDGRIAYVSAGRADERISTTPLRVPIVVGILNPRNGSFRRTKIPDAAATYVGWTGGWYSNVRDINAFPDGKLAVSWNESNSTPAWAILNDNLEIVEQGTFDGIFNFNSGHRMFFYQTAVPAQGQIVGTWSSEYTPFGVYFLYDELGSLNANLSADLEDVKAFFPVARRSS